MGSLVLLSLLSLLIQITNTDYGIVDSSGAAAFWFVVGLGLLALVFFKHSQTARVLVVVFSLAGAILYAFAMRAGPHQFVLVLAYLGQALPLMTRPVRRHAQHQ